MQPSYTPGVVNTDPEDLYSLNGREWSFQRGCDDSVNVLEAERGNGLTSQFVSLALGPLTRKGDV